MILWTMDNNEGNNFLFWRYRRSGKNVGKDSKQAEEMVNKVIDTMTLNHWKLECIVMISDDSDEPLMQIFKRNTTYRTKSQRKTPSLMSTILLDSYIQEASAGGSRYPTRTDFFNAFEKN
jgi:hypothetical protein